MTRFLHTADWQLGMTRRFLTGEAQNRFTQDRIDSIRRLGELAREHGAEFMVVAGDVFETNQVERRTVARALEALAEVPVPVFLLPGNHDPLDAASVFRSPGFASRRPSHVIVLDSSEPRPVPGLAGVEVVGAPWPTKRPLRDLVAEAAAGLAPAPPGMVRVLVGHGAVDALSPDPEDPALIVLADAERALAEGRVHYVALGDRHSVTRVGDMGAIWYAGSPVATDFDEEAPGKTLLVELRPGAPPELRELPVGAWLFVSETRDLAGIEDVQALARWLAERPE
ncbi:MAG: DNA repair exonuclease, partial [Candidatus Rokubacteria bacterium]|nr:DNA repair exonuclease [Candidatus Rokubacteria bacterium]